MKSLILDKSVLVAAAPGVLKTFARDFLLYLTPELLAEVQLKNERRTKLIARILSDTPDRWLPLPQDVITWELLHGISARLALAQPGFLRTLNEGCNFPDEAARVAYERQAQELCCFPSGLNEEEACELMRNAPLELFSKFVQDKLLAQDGPVERFLWDPLLIEFAARLAFDALPKWKPSRDSFCHALALVMTAGYYFKILRYGSEPADRRNLGNFTHDRLYLPYIVLADGLLSNDRNQLAQAWAYWPEKRDCLFMYDSNIRALRLYEP